MWHRGCSNSNSTIFKQANNNSHISSRYTFFIRSKLFLPSNFPIHFRGQHLWILPHPLQWCTHPFQLMCTKGESERPWWGLIPGCNIKATGKLRPILGSLKKKITLFISALVILYINTHIIQGLVINIVSINPPLICQDSYQKRAWLPVEGMVSLIYTAQEFTAQRMKYPVSIDPPL